MLQVDSRDHQLSHLSGLILWGGTSHTCCSPEGGESFLIGCLSSQIVDSGRLVVSTKCGHVFCSRCLRDALTSSHTCPTCRKRLTHRQYHPLYVWHHHCCRWWHHFRMCVQDHLNNVKWMLIDWSLFIIDYLILFQVFYFLNLLIWNKCIVFVFKLICTEQLLFTPQQYCEWEYLNNTSIAALVILMWYSCWCINITCSTASVCSSHL